MSFILIKQNNSCKTFHQLKLNTQVKQIKKNFYCIFNFKINLIISQPERAVGKLRTIYSTQRMIINIKYTLFYKFATMSFSQILMTESIGLKDSCSSQPFSSDDKQEEYLQKKKSYICYQCGGDKTKALNCKTCKGIKQVKQNDVLVGLLSAVMNRKLGRNNETLKNPPKLSFSNQATNNRKENSQNQNGKSKNFSFLTVNQNSIMKNESIPLENSFYSGVQLESSVQSLDSSSNKKSLTSSHRSSINSRRPRSGTNSSVGKSKQKLIQNNSLQSALYLKRQQISQIKEQSYMTDQHSVGCNACHRQFEAGSQVMHCEVCQNYYICVGCFEQKIEDLKKRQNICTKMKRQKSIKSQEIHTYTEITDFIQDQKFERKIHSFNWIEQTQYETEKIDMRQIHEHTLVNYLLPSEEKRQCNEKNVQDLHIFGLRRRGTSNSQKSKPESFHNLFQAFNTPDPISPRQKKLSQSIKLLQFQVIRQEKQSPSPSHNSADIWNESERGISSSQKKQNVDFQNRISLTRSNLFESPQYQSNNYYLNNQIDLFAEQKRDRKDDFLNNQSQFTFTDEVKPIKRISSLQNQQKFCDNCRNQISDKNIYFVCKTCQKLGWPTYEICSFCTENEDINKKHGNLNESKHTFSPVLYKTSRKLTNNFLGIDQFESPQLEQVDFQGKQDTPEKKKKGLKKTCSFVLDQFSSPQSVVFVDDEDSRIKKQENQIKDTIIEKKQSENNSDDYDEIRQLEKQYKKKRREQQKQDKRKLADLFKSLRKRPDELNRKSQETLYNNQKEGERFSNEYDRNWLSVVNGQSKIHDSINLKEEESRLSKVTNFFLRSNSKIGKSEILSQGMSEQEKKQQKPVIRQESQINIVTTFNDIHEENKQEIQDKPKNISIVFGIQQESHQRSQTEKINKSQANLRSVFPNGTIFSQSFSDKINSLNSNQLQESQRLADINKTRSRYTISEKHYLEDLGAHKINFLQVDKDNQFEKQHLLSKSVQGTSKEHKILGVMTDILGKIEKSEKYEGSSQESQESQVQKYEMKNQNVHFLSPLIDDQEDMKIKKSQDSLEPVRQSGYIFAEFICDNCNCHPVQFRYHCKKCDDYDLCQKCMAGRKFVHQHNQINFQRIGQAQQRQIDKRQKQKEQMQKKKLYVSQKISVRNIEKNSKPQYQYLNIPNSQKLSIGSNSGRNKQGQGKQSKSGIEVLKKGNVRDMKSSIYSSTITKKNSKW